MFIKKVIRTLTISLFLLGLYACGQSGPLQMPDEPTPNQAPAPEQTDS
ncbi:LPS translocon maturation chaperone LptM [Idiomarina xiamenensis]